MKTNWTASCIRNFAYEYPKHNYWGAYVCIQDYNIVIKEHGKTEILLATQDTEILSITALMVADLVPIGVFCDRLQEENGQIVEDFCNRLREWERNHLERSSD